VSKEKNGRICIGIIIWKGKWQNSRTEEVSTNPFFIFNLAIRSPVTREKYIQRMGYFFDFLGIPTHTDSGDLLPIEQRFNAFGTRATSDVNWLKKNIVNYLQGHRKRVEQKEITGSTLRNYIKPIKLFCEQMDIEIPWRKITRGMPRGRRYANDRAPTLEEIRKTTEYPDRRIKPTIYLMASSGIRLGAFDFLKWGDIEPIKKNGNLLAARIRVYSDEEEEYYSFITKEAYDSLYEWMKYRKESGEAVNESSWLMRNLWDVTTPRGKGVVTLPKKLKSSGVKRMMERALWAQGLRKELAKGKRRHEFQADHGFRKWFKTRCEIGGMKSINVETLMVHSIGIQDSYYRATSDELLQDYLKATDFLTISEGHVLQKQVQDLTQKTQHSEFVIESRLHQKEIEFSEWKNQHLKDVKNVLSHLRAMQVVQKETQEELAELKKYKMNHMKLAFSP
jgi:hypothetical protein